MTRSTLIIVPGDKSITHRALLLAAMARGPSVIEGALASLDARSSARVLRQLGAGVGPIVAGRPLTVVGRGRLRPASGPLHCGNSGTTARLLLGLLSAHRFSSTVTGDRSLRRRPMRRVTEPLTLMGARFAPPNADRLPLRVRGGPLVPLDWELPVSSAQLKSALLFAGLAGNVRVAVREPAGLSRDHTERMLAGLGFPIGPEGDWIVLRSGGPVPPFQLRVPGDPSSAAFLIGAGLIGKRAVTVSQVGLNPTRLGYLEVLRRMGARVTLSVEGETLGEPFGTIHAEPGELRGTVVRAGEIPGLIDEVPLLAALAARAEGETRFEQVGELRVKESDRLAQIAGNLTALGYPATGAGNVLTVHGSDHPPRGRVTTEGDHRIAMAFAVLGTVPGARIVLDDRDCVAVSFPGFFAALDRAKGPR